MANHRITVELNDETIRCLAAVGKPDEVLARLAHSAADGVRNRHPQRDQTDVSLRIERASTDARETLDSEAIESQAVAQAARETDRSAENAELQDVRAARRRSRSDLVAAEREATDLDLTGERANTDTLIVDLREANERMVIATIRADEMTDELRESEERYRTLFDLCPVAVYSCDVTGVILKFNRHAADLWGRAPALRETDERFCGSFKMFRMDGTFLPHDQCPMAEALSGKIPYVRGTEVLIERPDGSQITVVVNIRPVRDQRGEVTSAISCFYDITARKQAETQLADSLATEREVSEFREMFIGMLSHDLRTPLASINLAAAMLLERSRLDELDTKTVHRIINSDQRMTAMITQLLDLTRARLGGGLPLERAPMDLDALLRRVVDEFDATIQMEIDGDLTGEWDEGRLSEVVSNLVGNAIQYATRGTAVIVSARADRTQVIVEVCNQGDPIPADVLPFIFEPFRRARQREKSAAGNLGLGLYIARQIVLSHGGTLEGSSADGTTTFVMRIPQRPVTGLHATS